MNNDEEYCVIKADKKLVKINYPPPPPNAFNMLSQQIPIGVPSWSHIIIRLLNLCVPEEFFRDYFSQLYILVGTRILKFVECQQWRIPPPLRSGSQNK